MKVKLGFNGTGGIANHHLTNLVKMEDVKVVSFYDLDLQRAQKAASEHDKSIHQRGGDAR